MFVEGLGCVRCYGPFLSVFVNFVQVILPCALLCLDVVAVRKKYVVSYAIGEVIEIDSKKCPKSGSLRVAGINCVLLGEIISYPYSLSSVL